MGEVTPSPPLRHVTSYASPSRKLTSQLLSPVSHHITHYPYQQFPIHASDGFHCHNTLLKDTLDYSFFSVAGRQFTHHYPSWLTPNSHPPLNTLNKHILKSIHHNYIYTKDKIFVRCGCPCQRDWCSSHRGTELFGSN